MNLLSKLLIVLALISPMSVSALDVMTERESIIYKIRNEHRGSGLSPKDHIRIRRYIKTKQVANAVRERSNREYIPFSPTILWGDRQFYWDLRMSHLIN